MCTKHPFSLKSRYFRLAKLQIAAHSTEHVAIRHRTGHDRRYQAKIHAWTGSVLLLRQEQWPGPCGEDCLLQTGHPGEKLLCSHVRHILKRHDFHKCSRREHNPEFMADQNNQTHRRPITVGVHQAGLPPHARPCTMRVFH